MILIYDAKIYGFDDAVRDIGLSYNHNKADFNLAKKLASAKPCSGHDSFLKGITVNFMLEAPHYFIIEMQRYHFLDIVMSTSKMHSLQSKEFLIGSLPSNIDSIIEERLLYLYDRWLSTKSKEDWESLLANLPLGFSLKMRITTNYLQLKNIYWQRKDHKLDEWKTFCKWVNSLPLLEEVL